MPKINRSATRWTPRSGWPRWPRSTRWSRAVIGPVIGAVIGALALMLASSTSVVAGGGCHQPASEGVGTEVDIEQNCFSPTVLQVAAGETVTWTNRDQFPHAVTGAQGLFGDSEQLGLDETASTTFDEPGVFPYFCILHASMSGAIVVGDGAPPEDETPSATPPAAQAGMTVAPTAPEAPASRAGISLAGAALGGVLLGVAGAVIVPRTKSRRPRR